ncbi:hypothetical protein J2S41_005175 [Catenuloplanes atrovinosus]|uniref:Uncharacterized protein n=1 Tax=Catenuloplanes atrovinosus TaxID=137266 RepID=A0AAE4CBT7_9ACTN|nr:hypothetical protein [Catenuloplanes atrovinosus]
MHPSHLLETLLCTIPVLVTIGYFGFCRISPFGRCRVCRGTGRARRQYGRVSRACRRCDGTGLRVRTGTRAINRAARLYRDGAS